MTIYFSPFVLLFAAAFPVVVFVLFWIYVRRRLRLLETLRSNQEAYRTLYAGIPLPVVILDPRGNVRLWNDAAEKVFGWSEQEVIGRPFPIQDDEQRAEFHKLNQRLIDNKSSISIEVRRSIRSGAIINFSLSAATAFDWKNNTLSLIHIYENITKRKEAEQAAQESELIYRELFLEVQRQAQELSLLDKVRTALAGELELKTLFRKVVEAVAETYGYTLVSLYWREGDISVLQHQVGYSNVLERVPITLGVSSRVYRTREAFLVEDVSKEPEFLHAVEGLVSEICVPLLDQGEVVGFFNIESTNEVRLGHTDLLLIKALSEHINVAIERARLYTEVRESENLFRLLFNRAPIGMVIISTTGQYLRVNPAYCEIVGYSAEELLTMKFQDMAPPDDTDKIVFHFNRAVRGEQPNYAYEKRSIRKDGKAISVSLHASVIYDSEGDPLHIVAQIIDITERKRAEQALQESEVRYRAIVEDQTDLICRFSRDLKHTFVNEAYCRYFGRTNDEIIGQDFLTLPMITPEEQKRLISYFKELETKKVSSSDEQHLIMPNGENRWLLWTDHPIFDDSGTLIEFQSVGRDITERKKAEAVEREGRRLAEALHDAAAAITSTLDLQTVMLRILESVERVVPHDSAAIDLIERGHSRTAYWRNYPPECEIFFAKGSADVDKYPIAQIIRTTGKAYLVADTSKDPNWAFVPLFSWIRSHISAPMQVHGNILGILNLDSATPEFFNSTHLERLQLFADQAAVALENARLYERIRQHAAELEQRVADRTMELTVANVRLLELDRLKRKFIADVSHELRTPLSTLNLRLYLLEHDAAEKQSDHLAVLKKEFIRLKNLLDTVLTFSQDKLVVESQPFLEPINLNEIVEEVVENYRPRAEATDLNLSFIPTEDLPEILGQVSALVQVVANVLANALNYTAVGNVDVRTYSSSDGDRICLEIKDTGIGIAPEEKTHLFERFYRGQRVGSMNIPGMGLGLPAVKEIIDAYKGKIEVESQIDQGSTFRIWLPTTKATQAIKS